LISWKNIKQFAPWQNGIFVEPSLMLITWLALDFIFSGRFSKKKASGTLFGVNLMKIRA
jgi:hypothetical protein